MSLKTKALLFAAILSLFALPSAYAAAPHHGNMTCKMSFSLSGWSAIYQTANGKGRVTCSNGATMPVSISLKGAGLSVGKYQLDNGRGTFSGVRSIHDVLGSYAEASAHAGVVGSTRAAAMTKGPVSLALSGTGKGWDIGAGISGFTIRKAK